MQELYIIFQQKVQLSDKVINNWLQNYFYFDITQERNDALGKWDGLKICSFSSEEKSKL